LFSGFSETPYDRFPLCVDERLRFHGRARDFQVGKVSLATFHWGCDLQPRKRFRRHVQRDWHWQPTTMAGWFWVRSGLLCSGHNCALPSSVVRQHDVPRDRPAYGDLESAAPGR
jgi:hypothetical protein